MKKIIMPFIIMGFAILTTGCFFKMNGEVVCTSNSETQSYSSEVTNFKATVKDDLVTSILWTKDITYVSQEVLDQSYPSIKMMADTTLKGTTGTSSKNNLVATFSITLNIQEMDQADLTSMFNIQNKKLTVKQFKTYAKNYVGETYTCK